MPIKKRVLVISNYPIKKPQHGGQKRVAAIVSEYKKVFSDVQFVAIFVREHYPAYDSTDIYLTGETLNKVIHDHLTSDVQLGWAIVNDPTVNRKVKQLLTSFKPDIIEIEQVFPYIGLKQVLAELGMNPKIVHSSHNIETTMKEDIMKLGGATPKAIADAVQTIDAAESHLAKHSSVVAAVSVEDGEYYLKHGAQSYVLAPNGIAESNATPKALQYWKQQYNQQGVRRTAGFIGSAHLPNMQGVKKMIGLRLGFLPADTRLVLGGGVGPHLKAHFSDDLLDVPFWRRVINGGVLSEELLSGLIESLDVILLPIMDGGGSNLKTAEAILSGKKVVATTFAFRGYEQYLELPNIYIADTPAAFRKAIVAAMDAPALERTKAQNALAKQVQWQYSLKKMVEAVTAL